MVWHPKLVPALQCGTEGQSRTCSRNGFESHKRGTFSCERAPNARFTFGFPGKIHSKGRATSPPERLCAEAGTGRATKWAPEAQSGISKSPSQNKAPHSHALPQTTEREALIPTESQPALQPFLTCRSLSPPTSSLVTRTVSLATGGLRNLSLLDRFSKAKAPTLEACQRFPF